MRDIRADLRERLEVTARERSQLVEWLRALEARERCLRALLTEEELPTTGVHAPRLQASHTGLACASSSSAHSPMVMTGGWSN